MPIPSIYVGGDHRCFALTQRGTRCKNSAGTGEHLRQQALRLAPSDPSLADILDDLAVEIHCKRWHKERRFGFVDAAGEAWLQELQTARPIDITSRTSSSLLPTDVINDTQSLNDSVHPTTPVQQQQHRPLTRAYATAHGIDPAAATTAAVFQPYRRIFAGKIPDLIASKLQRPLPQRGQRGRRRSGHIYLFTRADHPGFVKIGYSKNVHSRLGSIQEKCQYEPILGYKSPYILDVYRIEQLIFEQLGGLRQYDVSCIHRVSCQRRHEEWFKISVADAERVIRQWVDWAQQNPYTDEGHLREPWKDYVHSWTRHCRRQRLVDGLDLHFGCELPPADEPGLTLETHGRRHNESHTSEDCSICYGALVFGQERLRACSQCRNCWHDLCIEPWLATSASCPMCRANGTINVTNV